MRHALLGGGLFNRVKLNGSAKRGTESMHFVTLE